MRKILKQYLQKPGEFTATFSRFSYKEIFIKNNRNKTRLKITLLLKDIKDLKGQVIADHLWVFLTPEIENLILNSEDEIRFTAISYKYEKDFIQGIALNLDYGLKNLKNVTKTGANYSLNQNNKNFA